MTSTDLEVIEQPAPVTLFRSDEPAEIIARATDTAASLAAVIRKQKLAVKISGSEHVRVEGWTLLGTLLGVFPYTVWSRPLPDGWEARCEARTMDGRVVGAAEAQCLRSESTWKSRDDYALRSMAQTRATSKAMRQPLGFVMALAGFDPTPAEEMPRGRDKQRTEPVTAPANEPATVPGSVTSLTDFKTKALAAGVTVEQMNAKAAELFPGRPTSSITVPELNEIYTALTTGTA